MFDANLRGPLFTIIHTPEKIGRKNRKNISRGENNILSRLQIIYNWIKVTVQGFLFLGPWAVEAYHLCKDCTVNINRVPCWISCAVAINSNSSHYNVCHYCLMSVSTCLITSYIIVFDYETETKKNDFIIKVKLTYRWLKFSSTADFHSPTLSLRRRKKNSFCVLTFETTWKIHIDVKMCNSKYTLSLFHFAWLKLFKKIFIF